MRVVFLLVICFCCLLPVQAQSASMIAIGERVTGSYAGTPQRYTFEAEAGDILAISAESDEFNVRMTIETGEFSRIINDSGGIDDNAAQPFLAPETKTYTVIIDSRESDVSGEFTLQILDDTVIPLAVGKPYNFDYAGELMFFYFEGKAGDIINITTEGAANIELELILYSTENRSMRFNTGFSGEPLIDNAILRETGTYMLALLPHNPGMAADITLNITPSDLDAIVIGEPVELELPELYGDVMYHVALRPGATYTLTMTLLSEEAASFSIELLQDSEIVVQLETRQAISSSITFIAPSSTDTFLRFNNQSIDEATYQVLIELNS